MTLPLTGAGPSAGGRDWWDPNGEGLSVWAAYAAKGAGSFAVALVDVSGNGNDAVDPGGAATPTWDAVNGWTFDGAAQYLTTTFVPQNDQSQSVLIQFTGGGTGNTIIFGSDDGANRLFQILPSAAVGNSRYRNAGDRVGTAAGMTAGNIGIAGAEGYQDGVDDTAVAMGVWVGAAVRACYIGCENNGAANAFHACKIQFLVIYDETITAAQMLAVATAMAAG